MAEAQPDVDFDVALAEMLAKTARNMRPARNDPEQAQAIVALGNHVTMLWDQVAMIEEELNKLSQLLGAISVTQNGVKISMNAGQTYIEVRADGTIELKGIKINASATTELTLRGPKISQN